MPPIPTRRTRDTPGERRLRAGARRRFGEWMAVLAIAIQVVIVAVHCPKTITLSPSAVIGAVSAAAVPEVASFCRSSVENTVAAKTRKPNDSRHHGSSDAPMGPCPICQSLQQIVSILPLDEIMLVPPPWQRARTAQAPPLEAFRPANLRCAHPPRAPPFPIA